MCQHTSCRSTLTEVTHVHWGGRRRWICAEQVCHSTHARTHSTHARSTHTLLPILLYMTAVVQSCKHPRTPSHRTTSAVLKSRSLRTPPKQQKASIRPMSLRPLPAVAITVADTRSQYAGNPAHLHTGTPAEGSCDLLLVRLKWQVADSHTARAAGRTPA
jgi:hypothetical protein